MALAEKFEKISLDEVSNIVSAVKSDGLKKSGLADNYEVLQARCGSKDEKEAVAACKTVVSLMTEVPESQVFVKECLGACLEQALARSKAIVEASEEAAFVICQKTDPFAMKSLLPQIFAALPVEKKWQIRERALKCIALFPELAPKQLGDALPEVVPEVTACMWDTKKQVKVAATAAMKGALNVIGNRDIEHMTAEILTAISKPKEVPEIMHKMAGVTFVQSVESPALAMVVPLLLRGLREKNIATKRQSAVIIDNMSKLVDNPLDAAPFLPLLLPALESNAKSIADPEAREVTERAVGQLERLKGLADKAASVRGDTSKLEGEFQKALGVSDPDAGYTKVIQHACTIATTMMDLKYMEDLQWTKNVSPILATYSDKAKADEAVEKVRVEAEKMLEIPEEDDDDDDAEELCNCTFTLAYGTKILLHNTKMKLKRGKRYGLLGPNDCGKTTLMRSIANNQVEGFPDTDQVRTVFVEADIQGEQSHLSCVEYVCADPKLQKMGIKEDEARKVLGTVGFTPDGKAKPDHAVSTLSGGWRMKLALARAMLQRADILLLDEPTNHLDVINVAWVKTYLNSLDSVTSIIVSHDSGLLNDCCTHILSFDNLKLNTYKGNLDEYVKTHPAARAYFSLSASKMKFKFPQPGPIEGVKSKGKALMKMSKCTFTYPGNEAPTLFDISIQVSLSSRVACIGENGAGKSTMIKLLVGEIIPQIGDVWKHPNARIAYVAQHAFHHIESHLSKTPNEYIRWRFANGGEDKESLVKVTLQFTDDEIALQKKPFEITFMDEDTGKISKVKKVVAELVGGRKLNKAKEYEYEVKYSGSTVENGEFLPAKTLKKMGWDKAMKAVDLKLAQLQGVFLKPLSTKNVEEHLEHCGLAREFGTHYRISALSGGQKVKVVLAAAMWMQPHIVILDEPTNYLDRESLGALAGAIETFDGGVVIISHNNQFVSQLCPETWVMDAGHLETKGDADWMLKQDEKIDDQMQLQEMTDAAGNKVEIKQAKKKLSKKEEKQMIKKIKAKIKNGEPLDSDEEDLAYEKDLL
ncbi:[NU+] prion formation protein 1 [Seminavis robusta]|uniref:[NU+] prion formation protein 1 n=1 Tax=Seminavis robusta TaxID=568900 RepID=A0A9N8HRR6_9STRA|nr:[NU+] prion formation protein 1 [Seminavis robusta]|eukprot:Sro1610_g285810.1 [NU+] prion formation protein 1 (1040) ;mRNA; f:11100-14691